MSNEEILKKRWKKTDETLKEYIKKFDELNKEVIDQLIDMFDTLNIKYSDLNKSISKTEKRKLERKIKSWQKQGILTGYFAYLVSYKRKYTYSDLLEILIYGIYAEQESKKTQLSKKVFTIVANDVYSQAYEEISNKPSKKKTIDWNFIEDLLWVSIYNKSWKEYLKLLTMTAQQEMYKEITSVIQQDRELEENMLKDLVKKQSNRFLSINDDKYSGVLSDTCRMLGNKVYTQSFKDKDLQVRFIAEIDNRTTKMCESMDNMLFYVNDWNKFYRYSDIDGKDVLYTVMGLEIGINLPPINNHFHWCRSTVTYQILKDIRINYKNITNSWLKSKKINEHYEIKQLEKEFNYKGSKYIIDGHYVKYEFKPGEKEFANWLSKNSNKHITLLPKINEPEKVKTPDYLIDDEYFDFKYTTGSSNQLIFHNLENQKEQSVNFIIEINSKKLELSNIYNQVESTYKKLKWVKKIGIKKDDMFIIFERK